ncbi:MAG: hypothetical protein KGH72_00950 [Candidatus Micrarchaeota archaeon]|nr:hypothetical protein [Candidatus Micrarchaeota archaeon]
MAAGIIPRYTDEKPLFKGDVAYDKNCIKHGDCKATKELRETVCKYCGKNLDKAGMRFYDIGEFPMHVYVHADCEEDYIEQEQKKQMVKA